MEEIKINDKTYIPKEEYDKLNSKKEKEDFSIVEPCSVMAIVRVTEEGKNYKISLKNWEFPKENELKLMVELSDKPEKIEGYLKGELFVKLSVDFYKQAEKVTKLWNNLNKSTLKVYIREKDSPVLITDGSQLGFVLAPRVEE